MLTLLRFALVAIFMGFGVAEAGNMPHAPGVYPFCLVTHYTQNGFHYGELAGQNHAKYAAHHGYGQRTFVGRLSGGELVDSSMGDLNDLWGGGLFWQKLVALRQVFNEGVVDSDGMMRACDWVMWLDSDAIITGGETTLEEVLAPFVAEMPRYPLGHVARVLPADIVLSRETDHPVNSGVFFVRNTPVGRSLIDALLTLYPMYKDNNLPDQTALGTLTYLSEPWPSSSAVFGVQPCVHPSIRLAPQRSFNAFYGVGRTWQPEVQWQRGDFVAHLAGTAWSQREQAMRELLASLEMDD